MPVLKIKDSDTGEAEMHIVKVPEGFSFQQFFIDKSVNDDTFGGMGYISVIISPNQALELYDFLIQNLQT